MPRRLAARRAPSHCLRHPLSPGPLCQFRRAVARHLSTPKTSKMKRTIHVFLLVTAMTALSVSALRADETGTTTPSGIPVDTNATPGMTPPADPIVTDPSAPVDTSVYTDLSLAFGGLEFTYFYLL